jgi:hypothetical protein
MNTMMYFKEMYCASIVHCYISMSTFLNPIPSMIKLFCLFPFLFLSLSFGYSQNVKNISSIDDQLKEGSQNLIIIGETHTSAASSLIVDAFLKHLNDGGKNFQFLVEAGPSTAYLLNRYLEMGNEELLIAPQMFYGVFNEWRDFWRKMYLTNRNLPKEEQLKVIGYDMERPGIFARAMDKLSENYKQLPSSIDSLNKFMRTEEFLKNIKSGFPTKEDQVFMNDTKALLKKNLSELEMSLNDDDLLFIKATLNNHVVKFAGDRENELYANVKRELSESENKNSVMLIGGGHANYSYKTLAFLLKSKTDFNIINFLILYHNSKIWIRNDFKKQENIDDLQNKPWKTYKKELVVESEDQFTIIPLAQIGDLKRQADFVVIAQGQEALTY